MKVNIGPHVNYFGPHQLAEMLCFFAKKKENEDGFKTYPDYVYNFGKWLSTTPVTKLLTWVHSKKSRKMDIRIDHYDIWDMDTTLSYIILPMLKQLKEVKHGVPVINDYDYPDLYEVLSKEIDEVRQAETDIDDKDFEVNVVIWNFILNEMIWAFEQKQIDWMSQYYTKTDSQDNSFGSYRLDMDGYAKHNDRMNRGFTYFGRFYQTLWD
jgi:hypothetical protein